MSDKIDTRAIGLDVGSHLMKWLTGSENMHYGYWAGLDVNAGNLGPAQSAYTDKLFGLLPPPPARILDIGGGAGETARKLTEAGYEVDIVIPSPLLADRCRENAPKARVHLSTFEDFRTDGQFDVCMFSESFQYIPLDQSVSGALRLLAPGGAMVLADCFRTEAFRARDRKAQRAIVGGGHGIWRFREMLETAPVEVVFEEDITEHVAPSVDIEQGMFNVLGYAWDRVDEELSTKRPRSRWVVATAVKAMMSKRKRDRLAVRLKEQTRTSEAFCTFNRYLMMKLVPKG